MIKRTTAELAEIVRNFVAKNATPNEDFCPNLYLRTKRQIKGKKIELIYDCKNNVIFRNDEIPEEYSCNNKNFINYSGYDAKNNEQVISIVSRSKYETSEYARYIPELKMIEFSTIKIDSTNPKINKNFDIEGNPIYRLDKSETPRKWEYTSRYFLFRDSVEVFDFCGNNVHSKSIIYNICHKPFYHRTSINNYEWKKFLENSSNLSSTYGTSFWDSCRKRYFDLQEKHIKRGNPSAQWKKEIMRIPLSPIEDISLECKSVFVPSINRKTLHNYITKSSEENVLSDESVSIYDSGYYYEKVNDNWSVFRKVKRDINSKEAKNKVNKFMRYKYSEIYTPMEEYFRVYINNSGETFIAEYSPFIDEWYVSRASLENLEYRSSYSSTVYNWNEVNSNPFINENIDFLNEIEDKSKIRSICALRTKDKILKEMIERDLPNMFAKAIVIGTNVYLSDWFELSGSYPTSLSQCNCTEYQLRYLDSILGDSYDYHDASLLKEVALLFNGNLTKASNEEFDEAVEFYNIVKSKTNRRLEYLVNIENDHYYSRHISYPTETTERLNNIFELWKDNKTDIDWLESYIETVNSRYGVYDWKHVVADISVNNNDFKTLEGIKIIKSKIYKWINDVNASK